MDRKEYFKKYKDKLELKIDRLGFEKDGDDNTSRKIDFCNLFNSYFKDICPFLLKMSVKRIEETGFVESRDGLLCSRMKTYQYYCFAEDNAKDEIKVMIAIKGIIHELERQAKKVYNPLYPQMNVLVINEDITCQSCINTNSERVIIVRGRFGFFNIMEDEGNIISDLCDTDFIDISVNPYHTRYAWKVYE